MKSCPFCGSKVIEMNYFGGFDSCGTGEDWSFTYCTNLKSCNARFSFTNKTKEEAIEIWNHRESPFDEPILVYQ